MSTISNSQFRLAVRFRTVTLALIVALATAALTLTIVFEPPDGAGPSRASSTALRQFHGGPAERKPGLRAGSARGSTTTTANDGADHSGARP